MDGPTLEARFRVIQVLWFGLLGGVTVFAVVVVALITGTLGTWEPTLESGVALLGLAVAPLLMVTGIVFRRSELEPRGDEGARVAAYQNRVIIASAMQEGGGLLGMVMGLLAGQATWVVGVWALTAAAMLLSRPSEEELRRLLR